MGGLSRPPGARRCLWLLPTGLRDLAQGLEERGPALSEGQRGPSAALGRSVFGGVLPSPYQDLILKIEFRVDRHKIMMALPAPYPVKIRLYLCAHPQEQV